MLLKSEQLEDGLLLGVSEYFFEEGQGDFRYAVVDNFDVELFVDHDVFGLNKYRCTLMSLWRILHYELR